MPNETEITLCFNEHQLNALYEQGIDVENDLTETFNSLYDQFVPDDEQQRIKELIRNEQEKSDLQTEENRRFSLLTVTQGGKSVCYEYNNCQSFFKAASWFVKALEESKTSPVDDGIRTNPSFMRDAVELYQNDSRITLCAELNHDKGHMRVWCEGFWMEFSGEQLTKAVLVANHDQHLTPEQREEIFEANINEGVPIFNIDEDTDMGMQM